MTALCGGRSGRQEDHGHLQREGEARYQELSLFLLIHVGLLKAMWDEAEPYQIKGQTARRVFRTPRDSWSDPETGMYNTTSGTSDLDWCNNVIKGDYLRKSGWSKYVDNLPDPAYPFIVDTNIWTWHINPDGQRFPSAWPPKKGD